MPIQLCAETYHGTVAAAVLMAMLWYPASAQEPTGNHNSTVTLRRFPAAAMDTSQSTGDDDTPTCYLYRRHDVYMHKPQLSNNKQGDAQQAL
jgi:hypothetical protein